ncbi:MAG: hypothetical protein HQL86_01255 [Magnetococcales bacterium]|nr:hypothetical protein [Magnetococcales bacterium]
MAIQNAASSGHLFGPCSPDRFANDAKRSGSQGWREDFFTKIVKNLFLKDAPKGQGQNQNVGGFASEPPPGIEPIHGPLQQLDT